MDEAEPGVLLLDDARVFVAVNEVAATLLGTTEQDLLGRRADEFMPLVARPLYPLAWHGFLFRGRASGDYAALRTDGSLQHLAYVGFAHRPIRGLHFFLIEPLAGRIEERSLRPRPAADYIQVGDDLPEGIRDRLVAEADRAEWKLPVAKGATRAVVAAMFEAPEAALDALEDLRRLGSVEASLATAAGATKDRRLTVLAGRVAYTALGQAIAELRGRGGRIIANVDERWTRG